jgi:hypothetical protein
MLDLGEAEARRNKETLFALYTTHRFGPKLKIQALVVITL